MCKLDAALMIGIKLDTLFDFEGATRCFATIYAQSILCLFIKVELCMIGGYLLVESMSDELLDFNSVIYTHTLNI